MSVTSLIRWTVLISAFALVVSQAAVAGAGNSYTPQALKAMGERYQAEADYFLGRPAQSYYTPQALKALGQRYEAMGRFFGTAPVASTSPSSSFRWRDALIGAGTTLGA